VLLVNKGVAHPWQCDVQGHLTTRFYVAMFDDASYHFLQEVFGKNEPGMGWADVRHVIEYQAEVSAGDLLEVHGELLRLGGKSVTVRYEMTNLETDQLAATLESTSVLFDLERRCAVAFSEQQRAAAAQHLPD
jgi:acyl-CoA thioester hydrolase